MDQEIIKPAGELKKNSQALNKFGVIIASSGVTLMTVALLGSFVVATIWAMGKLLGLPETLTQILMLAGLVPTALAAIWTAGRAWHVERLLAQHKDIDNPVFELFYYYKKH